MGGRIFRRSKRFDAPPIQKIRSGTPLKSGWAHKHAARGTSTSAGSPPNVQTVQTECTQSADLSTLLKRLIFKAVHTKSAE